MEGVPGGLSDASTGSACCGEPNDPSVTSRPCGNDCTHGLLGAAIPRPRRWPRTSSLTAADLGALDERRRGLRRHWRYEGRLARLEPCTLEGNIRESVEQFRIFVGLLTASVP